MKHRREPDRKQISGSWFSSKRTEKLEVAVERELTGYLPPLGDVFGTDDKIT